MASAPHRKTATAAIRRTRTTHPRSTEDAKLAGDLRSLLARLEEAAVRQHRALDELLPKLRQSQL